MGKWYLLGVGIAAIVLATALLLPWSQVLVLAAVMALPAIIVAAFTNGGMPYTYEAGWSDVQQRPWTVQAGPSPVGAVATGYIGAMALVALCFIVWGYVTYDR